MSDQVNNLKHEFERIGAALQVIEKRVTALRHNVGLARLDTSTALDRAKDYYRKRRVREHMFGNAGLFADPAWDILIDLFIASEEGRQVSISSACIAAAVPGSTALRWVTVLESRRLIVRTNDPLDARRIFIALTSETVAKLRTYFEQTR